MTKSELIARLAQRYPQLVAKDAEYAVKMILDAMTQSLLGGHRIEIRGFGSFGLNYRPPRTGRNPKSGEKVQVPEKYVPHFKAGKELRERVDSGDARRPGRAAGARFPTCPLGRRRTRRARCASSPGRSAWWCSSLLVAFAAKNVEPVTLRFYFDLELKAPLVLALLGAFALGALFGVARPARHGRAPAQGDLARSGNRPRRRRPPPVPPL